jgi:hypothetical protein
MFVTVLASFIIYFVFEMCVTMCFASSHLTEYVGIVMFSKRLERKEFQEFQASMLILMIVKSTVRAVLCCIISNVPLNMQR